MNPASTGLESLVVLLLLLLAFFFAQRSMHRAFLRFFLYLTRREALAVILFSLALLPGVLVHEGSHYLTARLLGVRTGRFSVLPRRLPGGQLRMGYVEVGRTGFLRASLIGAAPLVAGILLLAWIGSRQLFLTPVLNAARAGDWPLLHTSLAALPAGSNFWLWFYLAFCISGTMLPSASDRHAWSSLAIAGGLVIALALLVGAGPWMEDNLLPMLARVLRALNMVLLVCLVLQAALAALFGAAGLLLSRLFPNRLQ